MVSNDRNLCNGLDPQRGLSPKASLGTPIQRIGAPEEIAAFVSYVASDSAGFVTGKVDLFFNRHIYSPGFVVYAPRRPMCMSIFSSASFRGLSDIITDFRRWWFHS